MRRFLFVLTMAGLVAAMGVLLANRPPDKRPPRGPVNPPPPTLQLPDPVQEEPIVHRVFATGTGIADDGAQIGIDGAPLLAAWQVNDLTDDGEPAIMSDSPTGFAPDIGADPIPFAYLDLLLPGVVFSEFEAIVTGLPYGAFLICETKDEAGNLLDRQQVEQLDRGGAPVTVHCIYSKGG